MDRELFIQPSVRIRNLEKKLLTKIQFERLYEADDLQDSIRHLNETVYSEDLAKIDRAENFEIALSSSLNKTYNEILSISPIKELVDVLTYKFAFHNMKVIVKEKILQEDFEHIYSKVHYEDLDNLKKQFETEKGEKGTWYEDTIIQAYKIFEKTKDPEKIEVFIDKRYFEKVLEISKKFGLDLIEEYFKTMIDFINIRTFIRCKRQEQDISVLKEALIQDGYIDIDDISSYFYKEIEDLVNTHKNSKIGKSLFLGLKGYNETGRLLLFEKYMENYLTNLLKERVKRMPYGPEIIFAYVHAKEIEIKNLRIALVGRANGLSPDFIKERLRETYV